MRLIPPLRPPYNTPVEPTGFAAADTPIRWADLLALKLAWAFDVPDVKEDCEE